MAEVYAADIYTAEMHAHPSNQQWSRSCSGAEIAAEVASLIQPILCDRIDIKSSLFTSHGSRDWQ